MRFPLSPAVPAGANRANRRGPESGPEFGPESGPESERENWSVPRLFAAFRRPFRDPLRFAFRPLAHAARWPPRRVRPACPPVLSQPASSGARSWRSPHGSRQPSRPHRDRGCYGPRDLASARLELVARGDLPSLRLGRRIVVPRHGLERLLDGDADGTHAA